MGDGPPRPEGGIAVMAGEPAIAISTFAGKGPAIPLEISQQGVRRFVVGLSWGSRKHGFVEIPVPHLRDENGHYDIFYFFKLPFHLFRILVLSFLRMCMPDFYRRGVTDFQTWKRGIKDAGRYDLDLACYVFDAGMKLQCIIGPEDEVYADESRKVYHSGDDKQGSAGGADDEQAFVETFELPENYAHFFFIVETDGRYSLNDTPNASVRLADSRSNKNALKREITPPEDSAAHGYVFCHVFRDTQESKSGWAFRDISEYVPFSTDWVKYLQQLSMRG